MTSGNQIWIESNYFKVEPGEEDLVNKGVFGKQLAGWLVQLLTLSGEPVIEVLPEDWGWCIMLKRNPDSFIGCANRYGKKDEWGVFVEVQQGFLQRIFRGGDAKKEVKRLEVLLVNLFRNSDKIKSVNVEPAV